jgi:hypothetical protein
VNTLDVSAKLDRAGVVLTARVDCLAFDAPAGVMTPETLAMLRGCKSELLDLVRHRDRIRCEVDQLFDKLYALRPDVGVDGEPAGSETVSAARPGHVRRHTSFLELHKVFRHLGPIRSLSLGFPT